MLRSGSAAPSLLLLILFASAPYTLAAAPANYGDFGPDFPPGGVIYQDVTESSGTDDLPLFTAPTITGDDLDFDPKGFIASAADGNSDVTDGQLNFTLQVLEGAGVLSLLLSESGDFTLFGTGTAATAVSAGLSMDIDILEVDHQPLPEPISVFASNSIVRDLVTDGPVVLAPWDNGVFIEFSPILTANQIDFDLGVTRAEIVIDDQLLATSETLSIATIAKKDFRIEPELEGIPVPEPAAAALLILGGFAFLRRR